MTQTAIDQTKKTCNIDENRVYITGTSAGTTGVMHAAADQLPKLPEFGFPSERTQTPLSEF